MRLPKIKATDDASLVIALSERFLYTQNHTRSLQEAGKIFENINLSEVEKLTQKHGWNFFEFLYEFFKNLGYKTEIKILLEDNADKIIDILQVA